MKQMDFETVWQAYVSDLAAAAKTKEKLEGGIFQNFAGGALHCSSWSEQLQMCIVLFSMIVLVILVSVFYGTVPQIEGFLAQKIQNDVIRLFDIQSQQSWSKIINRFVTYLYKVSEYDLQNLAVYLQKQPKESWTLFIRRRFQVLSNILVLSQLKTFNSLIGAMCTLKKFLEKGDLSNKEYVQMIKYGLKNSTSLQTFQTNFPFLTVQFKEKQD